MLVFAGRVKAEPIPAVECSAVEGRTVEGRDASGGVLLRGLRSVASRVVRQSPCATSMNLD
jgi:hypothetical protein